MAKKVSTATVAFTMICEGNCANISGTTTMFPKSRALLKVSLVGMAVFTGLRDYKEDLRMLRNVKA